jgi:DNA-binding transcriptional ArsR family regulator
LRFDSAKAAGSAGKLDCSTRLERSCGRAMARRDEAAKPNDADGATQRPRTGQREKGKTNRLTAMSHPLRARILRVLYERDVMSPAQLSRVLKAELSDVSYHVRRLETLECAELVSTRPVRGALEHFYRAIERPLIDTDEFEELDPISAEDLVCQAIQRTLDDFVDSRKAKMVGYDKHFHISRTPLVLDEEGFQEGMDAFERCRLELSEIERKSTERRAESGAPGIATSADLQFFKMPNASLDN